MQKMLIQDPFKAARKKKKSRFSKTNPQTMKQAKSNMQDLSGKPQGKGTKGETVNQDTTHEEPLPSRNSHVAVGRGGKKGEIAAEERGALRSSDGNKIQVHTVSRIYFLTMKELGFNNTTQNLHAFPTGHLLEKQSHYCESPFSEERSGQYIK